MSTAVIGRIEPRIRTSRVFDAQVVDAVAEQPWLPNGPIPTSVEWSLSGSDRHGAMG